MTDKQWRKFGEIQYLRGRLDEMFKIDTLLDFDMSGMRRIDARIAKYMDKLKSVDEMTYELYLIERDNIYHKIRKLTKDC
mgnify:FL=1